MYIPGSIYIIYQYQPIPICYLLSAICSKGRMADWKLLKVGMLSPTSNQWQVQVAVWNWRWQLRRKKIWQSCLFRMPMRIPLNFSETFWEFKNSKLNFSKLRGKIQILYFDLVDRDHNTRKIGCGVIFSISHLFFY